MILGGEKWPFMYFGKVQMQIISLEGGGYRKIWSFEDRRMCNYLVGLSEAEKCNTITWLYPKGQFLVSVINLEGNLSAHFLSFSFVTISCFIDAMIRYI